MNNDYFEYVICHRLGEVGRSMSSGWVGLWRRPRQGCWWIQTHRIRTRAWSCIIKSRRCYNFPMRKNAKYDRKKCSNLILTKVERGVFLSLSRGFLQAPFFKGWVSKKKNYDDWTLSTHAKETYYEIITENLIEVMDAHLSEREEVHSWHMKEMLK